MNNSQNYNTSEREQYSTPVRFKLQNKTFTPISEQMTILIEDSSKNTSTFFGCVRKICRLWRQFFKVKIEDQAQDCPPDSVTDIWSSVIQYENMQIEPIISPSSSYSKWLVLDLDETLVHTMFEQTLCQYSSEIQIKGNKCPFYTNRRPGVESFIKEMSKYYQLVVFTAGLKEYADKLLSLIDPSNKIKHVLWRQHCTSMNKKYVKDLRLISKKLKNIVLLDNNPNSGLIQPDNLLLIKTFRSEGEDNQLSNLKDFLIYLAKQDDVRSVKTHKDRFFRKINNKENKKPALEHNTPILKKSNSNQPLKQGSRPLEHIR